ncbi:hypothetical protein ABZT03_20575, partial [Streptomyces sp. NPDC005574]
MPATADRRLHTADRRLSPRRPYAADRIPPTGTLNPPTPSGDRRPHTAAPTQATANRQAERPGFAPFARAVGLPQTVVLADDLTREAILDGIRAGRSYVA